MKDLITGIVIGAMAMTLMSNKFIDPDKDKLKTKLITRYKRGTIEKAQALLTNYPGAYEKINKK